MVALAAPTVNVVAYSGSISDTTGSYSIRTNFPIRSGDVLAVPASNDAGETAVLVHRKNLPVVYKTLCDFNEFRCDHLNPGLIKTIAGNWLAVAMGHNDDRVFRGSVSDILLDDFTMTDIQSQFTGLSLFSYAELRQLDGETNDPIYLFFRASDTDDLANRTRWYSASTDEGATWSAPVEVMSNHYSYWSIAQNGTTRIDFSAIDGNENNTATSLYHFYYEGGTFYDTEGNALSLPIDLATDLTPIKAGLNNARCSNGQIAIDSNGRPFILYEIQDVLGNDQYKETRTARWNGTSWVEAKVCDMTDARALGGLDPEDPDQVFVPQEDVSGYFQIHKFTTANSGVSWTDEGAVTSGTFNYRRIRIVPGTEPRMVVMKGTTAPDADPHSWGDYQITLMTTP